MENFDKRMLKKSPDELQAYLAFRRKAGRVPAKKGQGGQSMTAIILRKRWRRMMNNNLNIYKIVFKGFRGEEDSVYMCAHSTEYAIKCFKDCSDDEILYVTEAFLADGFILD